MTEPSEAPLCFPRAETHLLSSKFVQQTFKVEVMRPACRPEELTRFPVVYVTDGNRCFEMCKGISHLLQSTGYDAPRFILVAIGYPSDAPVAGLVLRARDFTFPGYIRHNTEPPAMRGVLTAKPGAKNFDGAEDFQAFLGEELIPFIERTHPALPDDRTYFGHSQGGSFGLFTLFTKPGLFQRYIVSSPGLAYHGRSTASIDYEHYDFMLKMAQAFVASEPRLNAVRLHLSVGSEEEFEPILANWQLVSSFYRMVAQLQAAAVPGLQLTSEVLPGETHMSAWPVAFVRGIRAVFSTHPPTRNGQ